MIIVRFQGGTGNQIFQYAMYRKLKYQFPDECVLADLSSYRLSKPHNGYDLEKIFLVTDIERASDKQLLSVRGEYPDIGIAHLAGSNNTVTMRIVKKIVRIASSCRKKMSGSLFKLKKQKVGIVLKQQYESGYAEDPTQDIIPGKNYDVDGTWFNCDYSCIRGELHKALHFKDVQLDKDNESVLQEIEQSNSVCIHIRRGDYAAWGYLILDKLYYRSAISYMKDHLEQPKFFVFSDEPDVVKCEFEQYPEFDSKNFTFVHGNVGKKSYLDMFMMSRCKNMILANSTFSAAAELLNKNDRRIVIVPELWQAGKKTWIREGWIYL